MLVALDDRRDGPANKQVTDDAANAAKLSDLAVADAGEMWIAEEPPRILIKRYPEAQSRACSPLRGPLLVLLEERDDVVDILRIAQARERHAVAFDLGLRVLQIRAQVRFVPHQVGAQHRIRIAEIIERS